MYGIIRETLDNMVLIGERHLYGVLKKIEHHHNHHRPHQGIANLVPLEFTYPEEPASRNEVKCESALGGMLNHYYVEQAA